MNPPHGHDAHPSADHDLGPADFTHLALWTAASLAGLVTGALRARGPFFRALARRVGWIPSRPARRRGRANRPSPDEALRLLADAIVGTDRAAVAGVFGPPPCAAVGPTGDDGREALTWYYPMARCGPVALAIEFAEDSARRVLFLRPPPR